MKNKVLIKLIVPDLEESYDLFIPLNKSIGNIIVLIDKTLHNLNSDLSINFNNCCLYNSETALPYDPSQIIRETNIRNASEIILL